MNTFGVDTTSARGPSPDYQPDANCEYRRVMHRRHTAGANVRRGEKQPRPPAKVPKSILRETKGRLRQRDVGLEAATI